MAVLRSDHGARRDDAVVVRSDRVRSKLRAGRLEIDRNGNRVHDHGRTVLDQRVVQRRRNGLPVHRQRDVIRAVGVQREYRHLLPTVFRAVGHGRRLVPASFFRLSVVVFGQPVRAAPPLLAVVRVIRRVRAHATAATTAAAAAAAVFRAEPLFDVRLELVHGSVRRMRIRERYAAPVRGNLRP